MATQTIHGYTAASTIDATADFLLIDPASSGSYNKINRNVLLNITGAPVGTTDSQSLSNKTLGNTNTVTAKDTLLTLQNASDTTKQANFSLAGVTTGTTRTYTLPNASVTLASLSGTETLTNKTITSPTLTGGTIDNSTITVDSISGHTVATTVTVGGVQLNNGTIGTTGAVTSTSIAAGAVVPNSLVASSGSGWVWQSWTPTLTSLSGGTITTAKYVQIGKLVYFLFYYSLNGANISGSVKLTLPVAAHTDFNAGLLPIGQSTLENVGVSTYGGYIAMGIDGVASTTTATLYVHNAASTYLTADTLLSSTVPHTWKSGDHIKLYGCYEAA